MEPYFLVLQFNYSSLFHSSHYNLSLSLSLSLFILNFPLKHSFQVQICGLACLGHIFIRKHRHLVHHRFLVKTDISPWQERFCWELIKGTGPDHVPLHQHEEEVVTQPGHCPHLHDNYSFKVSMSNSKKV